MKRTLIAMAWLSGTTLAFTASAGETKAPEAELLTKCTICHGDQGISDEPAYPSIAGLPVELQIDAMHGYREGTRDCGPVPRMCKIAKELTDAEIQDLAQHFAALPFKPASQPFDAELAKKGAILHEDYCEVCHGDNPKDAEKSILHGQWAEYLRYALTQYREGHRKQPPSMRRQTDKLSDADIEALVNFYASYRSP
jgi:sulfide dehydrogenase cytochrome subunit